MKKQITNHKQPITKNILMGDLVRSYPKSVKILLEQGMHCVGCHIATWETLEQAAESHGIDVIDILEALNATEVIL